MAQLQQALSELRLRAERELKQDILPFWADRAFDPNTGRLAGVVAHDLRTFDDVPRHAVLCARILWTFAAAYRVDKNPRWLATGKQAYQALTQHFLDAKHGGVFWSLDASWKVLSPRKQIYAQAFSIYGLAEWFLATGDNSALVQAQKLFRLIEAHASEPLYGGYIEALGEDWTPLADMRLSPRDLNAPKSMNTLLHVMEAYTTLLRAWPDEGLRQRLSALLEVLLAKVVVQAPFTHCALFFEMDWRSTLDAISYGHDIEASWLLWEAAEAVGNPALSERTRTAALGLAEGVLRNGLDSDGAVFYAGDFRKVTDTNKHWWPQAEAVVGFLNAYSLSGREDYAAAAQKAWSFIESKVVDPRHGEWFAVLDRSGTPLPDYPEVGDSCKIGPWKCPYHNARVCLELMRRI